MFRYTNLLIIAGGKSTRMGTCKSLTKIKNIKILKKIIETFYNLGFNLVHINGDYQKYLNKKDLITNLGPFSCFYTYSKNNNINFKKNILLTTIDMYFLNENIYFTIIMNSKKKYNSKFKGKTFPLLLSKNYILTCIILKFTYIKNLKSLSVKKILRFIFKKEKKIYILFNNFF